MQILSAYAPPAFSKPCLVWMTCQCEDTGEGAHLLGCFVDALNVDHVWEKMGLALAGSHSVGSKWFLMGEFESFFSAAEIHVKMAQDMQNGSGNEKWEAGHEPYLRIWQEFQHAPQYGDENG